jgi:hypothetical protein
VTRAASREAGCSSSGSWRWCCVAGECDRSRRQKSQCGRVAGCTTSRRSSTVPGIARVRAILVRPLGFMPRRHRGTTGCR